MSKIKIVTPENPEGVIRDMTAEEQTQHDNDVAKMAQEVTDRETAETNITNLKASAKAKLIAGEALTEDEANTIVL